MAVGLLKARFGGSSLREVPRPLLQFIANTTFRYGVRSIAHFIDVVESDAYSDGTLYLAKLRLPLTSEAALQDSSLKLHLLDRDQGFGIVNRWKHISRDKTTIRMSENRMRWTTWIDLSSKLRR